MFFRSKNMRLITTWKAHWSRQQRKHIMKQGWVKCTQSDFNELQCPYHRLCWRQRMRVAKLSPKQQMLTSTFATAVSRHSPNAVEPMESILQSPDRKGTKAFFDPGQDPAGYMCLKCQRLGKLTEDGHTNRIGNKRKNLIKFYLCWKQVFNCLTLVFF